MRKPAVLLTCILACSCASQPPPPARPPTTGPASSSDSDWIQGLFKLKPSEMHEISVRVWAQQPATTQLATLSDADFEKFLGEVTAGLRWLLPPNAPELTEATRTLRDARRQAIAATRPATTRSRPLP